jgi:hypothetical protein
MSARRFVAILVAIAIVAVVLFILARPAGG